METLHQQAEIIVNRYQIVTTLGQGGMGTTYAAVDLQSSQRVAIKVVSLRQTNDWKILELFEREAKVLANLNHPYIPNYIDYFELDTKDDKRFYLVQELVQGQSLAELVKQGWRATEAEVKDIAKQVLDILIYLHSITPPVIHRDIKPQNIIRRDDGKVYLVDFGAVQDVYRNTVSLGSTFVGTLGYMSLEHLRGNVTPASDLYSLGCSLLFLLTRKSPTDLPQKGMAIDFSSQVNLSHGFANWLETILQPIVEDRYQSAEDALRALDGDVLVSYIKPLLKKPEGSRITLKKNSQSLLIKTPSHNFDNDKIPIIALTILWDILIFPSFFSSIINLEIKKFLFLLPFFLVGIALASFCFFSIYSNIRMNSSLEINPQIFILKWTESVSFKVSKKQAKGNTQNIALVNLITGKGRVSQVIIAVNQQGQEKKYYFGAGYINDREAKWLVKEISAFLEQIRS
ncbi:serine/threonine-protein kinase [Pleurocapsa sp. PCC 7319]|uniref:serine/threonine protein kinase n=1 Tax=Pleurocapsa sp. PCC 7319 TaxID=118161 RepID=UPI00034893F2|nr:serine/threonine-protein kinase [Pleurocapsa sp. PCC 7319]